MRITQEAERRGRGTVIINNNSTRTMPFMKTIVMRGISAAATMLMSLLLLLLLLSSSSSSNDFAAEGRGWPSTSNRRHGVTSPSRSSGADGSLSLLDPRVRRIITSERRQGHAHPFHDDDYDDDDPIIAATDSSMSSKGTLFSPAASSSRGRRRRRGNDSSSRSHQLLYGIDDDGDNGDDYSDAESSSNNRGDEISEDDDLLLEESSFSSFGRRRPFGRNNNRMIVDDDGTLRDDSSVANGNGNEGSPTYKKTGTTIVGVLGGDYVVLACDTRATANTIVADKRADKLHRIASNVYACGAGTSADLDHVARWARYSLKSQTQIQNHFVGNDPYRDDDDDHDNNGGNNNNSEGAVSTEYACRLLQDYLYEAGGCLPGLG